ncbi:MAG: sigma-54 dependent transcriptional regulator [Tannerellaceae bacterium]|jgi:two-component system NtrC family response regulator|nr:sigma-54 dependent transcriptional regulator [Tannerellaceae bacterium]
MILIIDDDAGVRSSLTLMLKRAGYAVCALCSPVEALAAMRSEPLRLILMDMNFSLSTTGAEGLKLLKQARILCPTAPVILITAWGTIALAVEGMRAGAFDFVTKPWNNHALLESIRTALKLSEVKLSDGEAFKRSDYSFDRIIGRSEAVGDVLKLVARIAPTNASVLITGESGTGKELIAEAIHANSMRAGGPFVKVNLGGLSSSLFESEMFGHRKGAFTDAYSDRSGRFELASGGTIFLDEIGDLELSSQVKLLRVLQDQTYEPLGDSRSKRTNVRVVSATNADLAGKVADKSFREDLLYRINLIGIHLPPLRDRRADIPLLAESFAEKLAAANGLPRPSFTASAIEYLCKLPYPGNIRELKNLVERVMLLSGKNTLDAGDFSSQSISMPTVAPESATLDALERQSILQALAKHGWNLSQAALSLGISRAALYRRMEKYDIRR